MARRLRIGVTLPILAAAHIDHKLFLEIKRYLAAVDLCRAQDCEPTWRPESTTLVTSDKRLRTRIEHAPSAH